MWTHPLSNVEPTLVDGPINFMSALGAGITQSDGDVVFQCVQMQLMNIHVLDAI
jgi:hypothetical protein